MKWLITMKQSSTEAYDTIIGETPPWEYAHALKEDDWTVIFAMKVPDSVEDLE